MKTILTSLFNKLIKHGFIRPAMDVYEILSELKEEDYIEEEANDESGNPADPISVVNIVGLRGDTKPEQPNSGGMTVNPFFMDTTIE